MTLSQQVIIYNPTQHRNSQAVKQWIWLVWISKPINPILLGAKFVHARSMHYICRIVFTWIRLIQFEVKFMADSRVTPRQWDTSLKSNTVSHWLDASLESTLDLANKTRACVKTCVKNSLPGFSNHPSVRQSEPWKLSTKSCLIVPKFGAHLSSTYLVIRRGSLCFIFPLDHRCVFWGLFWKHGLTLIPARISNYMPGLLSLPLQPLRFRNG